ncbi:MAG: DUF4243 domain-containing protein [Myxococcales bacterium]|nr:DUF4243 domain-containing protein [Myxococcales bacterium]
MNAANTLAREALASLSRTSPEYGPSLTDHAAMVIEALERLDPDAIEPFAARYMPRLRELDREPDAALRGFSEQAVAMQLRIDREGWRAVLAEHAPSLAETVAGAAFHGLLRVAHAARGLARDDHPSRRAELARALVYARLRGSVLPQRPHPSQRGTLSLAQALAKLDPSPDALVHRPGLITPTLAERAAAHPTLGAVSAALRREGDPASRALELRREAARLLARGEHAAGVTFTLLHAVTGSEATLSLARVLAPELAQRLVDEASHALLAMRVAFVGALDRPLESTAPWNVLRARAVASLDDHAIKLSAALDDGEALDDDLRCAALAAWLSKLSS